MQDGSNRAAHRAFELPRRYMPPALSVICRTSSQIPRHVVPISTTGFGRSLRVERFVVFVENFPGQRAPWSLGGRVATLKKVRRTSRAELGGEVSGSHIEQPVDELILFANIIVADPPRLPLPDHVHRLVSLNRSPGGLKLAKALPGFHSSFERSMILLQDVGQILNRSMSAAAAQGSFLFH